MEKFGLFVLILGLAFGLVAFIAWILMLSLGAAGLTAFGFWPCFGLVFVGQSLTATYKGTST